MSDWEHVPSRREAGAGIIVLFITGMLLMATRRPFITLAFASIIPAMMGSWAGDIEYFIMGYIIDLVLLALLAVIIILPALLGGRRTT